MIFEAIYNNTMDLCSGDVNAGNSKACLNSLEQKRAAFSFHFQPQLLAQIWFQKWALLAHFQDCAVSHIISSIVYFLFSHYWRKTGCNWIKINSVNVHFNGSGARYYTWKYFPNWSKQLSRLSAGDKHGPSVRQGKETDLWALSLLINIVPDTASG